MSESMQSGKGEDDRAVRSLYIRAITSALSTGTGMPFMGVYAAKLGASPSELGLFHSLTNLFLNVFQVFWGHLSDRFRKYKSMLLLSSLFSSLLWIPMLTVSSPKAFIALASVQAVLTSMSAPAWMALVGALVPPSRVGSVLAAINGWTGIGQVAATVIAGAISYTGWLSGLDEFRAVFAISALFGVVSALAVVPIPEPGIKAGRHVDSLLKTIKVVRETRDFMTFLAVSSAFGFAMSIAWPLFTIVTADELGYGVFEVSIFTIAANASIALSQHWAGTAVDRVGRRLVIVVGRVALVMFPLVYAYTPSFATILLVNVVGNIAMGFLITALQAYLLDVTPPDLRASYTAVYNLALGLSFFTGSLFGGLLTDALSPYLERWWAIRAVFTLSAVLRLVAGLAHLKLREVAKLSENGA